MNSTLDRKIAKEFLDAFEEVFDRDWSYTKQMLGIREETEAQKKADQDMGLEPIYIISPDGTFANPGIEDEIEGWGNRGRLIEAYRALRNNLK